ncbi:hypothetical protein RHSIM_Rhsim02G0027500 [Rhododendron simsii]|uniref:Pentatricopeptide repeat-containing protein n=1 Tax=Rhododendron simsii TaxID=118357 RepID=A0A834LZ81_RHOSS|nr:hypothetical protein RHSIM_Rhsim02G0027500 [Rhododendron simsii]
MAATDLSHFLTLTNQNQPEHNTKHPSRTGSFGDCKNVNEVKQSHAQITRKGLNHTRPTELTKLISSCAEIATPQSLEYARKAYELYEAILIYVQTVGRGLTPDRYTFRFALNGCAKAVFFREGIQLHGSVLKYGLGGDLFIENCLVHFHAECGEIDFWKKVFKEMSETNVVTWTFFFFFWISVVTWTCLISGCARRDKPQEAVSLFFDMVEAADRAKQLFEECVDKNSELYNVELSNYVRQGMEREALAILVEMLQRGIQPGRVTIISVASAISQLGDFAFGRQFHGYVMRNGLDDWQTVGNAIIYMYANCGKQELACKVFDQMSTKLVVSWNLLIAGFARNGNVDSAWELFNEMPETDVVTWSTMIKALVHGRLFQDAIELFRVMQNEGVKANKRIHRDLKLNKALASRFRRCGDTESAMQVTGFAYAFVVGLPAAMYS